MQVNVNDDYEVRYWTAALGVPNARLAEVVAKVGPSVRAARKELEGLERAGEDFVSAHVAK